MSKRVVLVGHCGPDASYLRLAVGKALNGASIERADEATELQPLLDQGVDLLLVNRQLDWGFQTTSGIDLIRHLRAKYPRLRFMLISNFPEAQREAMSAGARPGFGKGQLRHPHVAQLLRDALE